MKKQIIAITLALMLILVSLCACTPDEPEVTKVTVTFNLNYEGAPAATTVEIDKDDVATSPSTDPVRTNYTFGGWYNEAACTSKADWEYGISADKTFYAKWIQSAATITFDPNYTDAIVTTGTATIGGTITQPADPSREGYLFDTWYKEAACTNVYDFSTLVTGDITLYAAWEEVQAGVDDGTVKISFVLNDGTNTEYYSREQLAGRRVTKPSNPTREGYAFIGWYTDANGTTAFSFNTLINADTTLYALWYNVYTFEAEYVYLNDLFGSGLSVEASGVDVIDRDVYNCGASNGYYVTYLYKNACTLEFNVTAAEATTSAQIVLRITAEVQDMIIKSSEYAVKVNGVQLSYDDITLAGVPEFNSGSKRTFDNWVVGINVPLQAGNNVIELITDNNTAVTGTMYATAPMVDCIYIYSPVAVTWTTGKCYESNLIGLPPD